MIAKLRNKTHAFYTPLSLDAYQIHGGFWETYQTTNRQVSLEHGYQKLEEAGNLNNLRLAAGSGEGKYRGYVFQDSDVYKWLEAASLELVNQPDQPALKARIDAAIGLVEAAQQPDGYLNSCFTVERPGQRWSDIDHGHELYCAGHLIDAAIAHQRATGDDRLMNVARRFIEHIQTVFGPDKRHYAPGHPQIETALVELYRQTGEDKYLELAKFFIDERGQRRMRGWGNLGPGYQQDRVPIRETDQVEGHAVRQLYLNTGVTDLYLETGEPALIKAMERQWQDMAYYKTYITGGFGALGAGEAFGARYVLPNREAYCETCAAIAGMMWNWRMLLATGEGRYADLLERTLYNAFLSGVALDGRHYFYENPLLNDGSHRRQEWFNCACCPPNVMRQIAAIGHYAATVNATGIQLHQYLNGRLRVAMKKDQEIVLTTHTYYPFDWQTRIQIEQSGGEWTLSIRIPAWSTKLEVWLNRETVDLKPDPKGYVHLRRHWRKGDVVVVSLWMPPRLTLAHPRVDDLRGMAALERGPLVYCLEAIDQPAGVDLADVRVEMNSLLRSYSQDSRLGHIEVIGIDGMLDLAPDWQARLYQPATSQSYARQPVKLVAIPYYAWANREATAMRVWLPLDR